MLDFLVNREYKIKIPHRANRTYRTLQLNFGTVRYEIFNFNSLSLLTFARSVEQNRHVRVYITITSDLDGVLSGSALRMRTPHAEL